MTVLITNWMLQGNSGTECFTKDLALGLLRRGRRPVVFTQRPGHSADRLREAGITVITHPADLPARPDVIHGHHTLTAALACMAWPSVPALFVCHDRIAWHDAALRLDNVFAWAGVDDLCRERLARETSLPLADIHWIGNGVNLKRFPRRSRLPSAPRRALVFSPYASEDNFLPVVRKACDLEGLTLDVAGAAADCAIERPEDILGQYDLVFAIGRCAMEALAIGCAVVLCGREGTGPMVSPENFYQLQRLNFGGGCLRGPHSIEALRAAMCGYDAELCFAVADLARKELDEEVILDRWEMLHTAVAAVAVAPGGNASNAASSLLAQIEPQVFNLFELKSAKADLEHAVARLRQANARHRAGHRDLAKQNRVLERECRRLREDAEASVRLTGILRRLWAQRWLRPLAKLLGVRAPRWQKEKAPAAELRR